MAEAAWSFDQSVSLSSEPVPRETIAGEVARAASGMTNSALARQAHMATRTLRAILDPKTTRRFGRATLDKLDEPLGWREGRAWTIYTAQFDQRDDEAGTTWEELHTIRWQMRQLTERVDQFTDRPTWAAELVDACRPLSDADRATVLSLARRLGGG
jgi:hypothetical protein